MKPVVCRPQTRFVLLMLALLAGGAIVNIAVAWGLSILYWQPRYIYSGFNLPLQPQVDTFPWYAHGGWPAKSLTAETSKGEGWIWIDSFFLVGGYCVAYRPIWPGFAINTVFYAAILWGLFAMPFAIRKRRRIKRGLCPKCAYPVGASERCTECGAAASQRLALDDLRAVGLHTARRVASRLSAPCE